MDLGQTRGEDVEVIPPAKTGRRRKFKADEKRKLVEEATAPGQSISSREADTNRRTVRPSDGRPTQSTQNAAQMLAQRRDSCLRGEAEWRGPFVTWGSPGVTPSSVGRLRCSGRQGRQATQEVL
jgi:hypothetical protein